jgi:hypothetical protein
MAQGYKGSDASMFDRGVRAHLGGEQITKFGNQRDFAAYTAGAKWAEEHNSVPQGALKKYEPAVHRGGDRRPGGGHERPGAGAAGQHGLRRGEGEAVRQHRDRQRGLGDDAGERPGAAQEHGPQRRREGRDGGPPAGAGGREALPAAGDRAHAVQGRIGDPRRAAHRREHGQLQPTKATSRAAAEAAIRKHEVTQAVHAAHAEGAIDNKERIRLLSKINQGRVADVAAAIPTKFSGEKALRTTSLEQRTAQRQAIREKFNELWQQVQAESDNPEELSVDQNGVLRAAKFQGDIHEEQARKVQSQLEGKTALQVTDMLVKNAPTEFHRVVAKKINSVMSYLTNAGMTFNFQVVRAGDANVPSILSEARGLAHDDAENDVTTIYINGTDGPGRPASATRS